jgi:hypothetical protein
MYTWAMLYDVVVACGFILAGLGLLLLASTLGQRAAACSVGGAFLSLSAGVTLLMLGPAVLIVGAAVASLGLILAGFVMTALGSSIIPDSTDT